MDVRGSIMGSALQCAADKRTQRMVDAQVAWLAVFGALDNPHVRLGLQGALVGAPADPEAFG